MQHDFPCVVKREAWIIVSSSLLESQVAPRIVRLQQFEKGDHYGCTVTKGLQPTPSPLLPPLLNAPSPKCWGELEGSDLSWKQSITNISVQENQ